MRAILITLLVFHYTFSYNQPYYEKVQEIVLKFQNCFSSLADSTKTFSQKTLAVEKFMACFEDVHVPFYQIFSKQSSYLPIKDFITIFQKEFKNGKIQTTIKKLGNVRANEKRNCYTSEHLIEFTLQKFLRSDSSDNTKFDEQTYELLLILKHQGDELKIISVSNPNNIFFNELSDHIQWWVNLEDAWKQFFKKKFSITDFPTEFDIRSMVSISELDLSNTSFFSYDPLKKFTELRKLNLENSTFKDLSTISNCKYLVELNASNTLLTDFQPLSNLKSLKRLYLNKLNLVDINFLTSLSKLVELEINENKLNNLEPLKELKNLEKLQCAINEIRDIWPVSSCVKLTDIRFGKNKVESLEPLQNLSDLVRIDAFNNEIKDLTPLKNCKKLAWLHIDFNPVTNLEPLSHLGYLVFLSMAHTNVKDLTPLKNLEILDKLNIAGTEISSLGPVKNMKQLSELKMNNTKISKNEAADYKRKNPHCKITYY